MQLFDSDEDECPWYFFDSSYKTLLGACLIIFGECNVNSGKRFLNSNQRTPLQFSRVQIYKINLQIFKSIRLLVSTEVFTIKTVKTISLITGVFGVLLNAWLYVTFIHSHLVVFKSHVLVLNLCSASLGRNLLGFPFASSSALAKR